MKIEEYLKPLFNKAKLCISRYEDDNNFENCERVKYDESSNTYKCSKCYNSRYILGTD